MDFNPAASVKKSIDAASAVLKKIGDKASSDMASDTINHVAYYARNNVKSHIKSVFTKPIARTVNSTFLKLATPNKPDAKIYIDDQPRGGIAPEKYLQAQAKGQARSTKRIESALKIAGILPAGKQIRGIDLDSAGNLSGARVKRMLNSINAPSDKSKWRVARRKKDGRPFGIFDGNKLFLVFTNTQRYQSRFKFFEVVKESWEKKIKEAWAKAWAKHTAAVIPAGMKR